MHRSIRETCSFIWGLVDYKLVGINSVLINVDAVIEMFITELGITWAAVLMY